MSKQCIKCGLVLPDNANFCRGCGSSEFKSFNNEMPPTAPIVNSDFQSPQAQFSPPPPVNTQPPKKNKTGLIIGIIAAVIIVAVIAGIAVFAFYKNSEKDSKDTETTTTTTTTTTTSAVDEDTGATAEPNSSADDDADSSSTSESSTSTSVSSSTSEVPSSSSTNPSGGNTKPSTNPANPTPTQPSLNPDSSKDDLLNDGTSAGKTTLRDDIIGNAIQNQKFTISMNMITADGTIPATISMNGNDMATKTSVSGIEARIIIKDGKTYMVMEATKKYFEMDDMGYNIEDLTPGVSSNDTYVGTTTVKDGGKTYTCETYETPAGAISKYYFLGNKWARYEHIDGSTVSILEINDFKASADASLFNLNGYTKMDLDSIM